LASQTVEVLIKAKNETDAAFSAVVKNLSATEKEAEKAQREVQRVGMAMARAHEDALRMNASMGKASLSTETLNVRAGKLSDAIGRTSTTLARSADAFGLSAGAMRTIGDVADVAQLGFENLSKGAAGFNASSLAVVGAGLAIGTALGNLAMQFDVVRENAYAAGEAIHNAFSSQQTQSVNEAAAATANWAVKQKEVAAAQEAMLRRVTSGKSAEEIQKMLFPEPPKGIAQRLVDEAKAFEESQKKKEAAAKQAAAAAKQADAERIRSNEEVNRLREHTATEWDKFYETLFKEEARLTQWTQEQAQARTDAVVKGIMEEFLAAREAAEARKESYAEMSAAMLDGIEERRDAELAAQQDFADALGMTADLLVDMGVSADNAFVSILNGFSAGLSAATEFAKATNNAQKAMAAMGAAQSALNSGVKGGAAAGAAFGAQWGIVGAGIGAVGGALLGWIGSAAKARAEMEKLRNEFVKSAGGMDALKKQALAAGISLDGMFKQKSAKALEQQIDTIKAKLQDWDDAQKILKEGMQEYGIAVSDMGGRFAALELDEQAKKMALFFAGATQIGANMGAVTAGMKDEVLALVAQYQAAGIAIPAALRPVLEAMLKNGQLTKENGEAYGSLEEAGFSFAETMEGALSNLTAELAKLRQVLAQGFHIPITYDVNGEPGAPSGPGGGGAGGNRPPREEIPEFGSPAFIPYTPGGVLNRIAERSDEYAIPAGDLKQLIAGAIAAAGAGSGGSIQVTSRVVLNNRELGQANAFLSKSRQTRTSPNANRKF